MAERVKFFLIVSIFLITWPMQVGFGQGVENSSENINLWRKLNQTSDKILTYMKEGHYEEANELLNNFSDQFLAIRAADYDLTMKELQIITTAYDEVKEATVSVSMSPDERIHRASKLRLLVDVYENSIEPLWKNTRKSLLNPIKLMERAIDEGNLTEFRNELLTFIQNYEMVRPAWSVSLPTVTYQQADAQVQYLLHIQRNTVSKKELLNHLSLMEKHFNNIYDGVEEDTSDPQLIWVILTIGGAILLALSYTGWKKYKAEKEKERERRQKRRRLY